MMVAPGRLKDIDERALAVADELGWTIDRSPNTRGSYPKFHFGEKGPWEYFTQKVKTQRVGRNHNLDSIEPYCATHKRSWRSSKGPGGFCTPDCAYGMRIR